MLVFESTSDNGVATPFYEEWGDKKVQYLRVHGSAGYYVSGFQLVDKDHGKSEILGKPGKKTYHPFQTAVVLEEIKFISVDYNSTWCFNISFQRTPDDVQEVFLGNYDYTKKSFNLEDDEMIVGVYGESYENYHNCLKKFGFIIGKQFSNE